MDNITFDDLPKAFVQLFAKIENVEKLLLQNVNIPQKATEELLTVQDAANFLSLSVPTIYGLISKGQLPVMKRAKRCYFSKDDLLDYVKQGRKKTLLEIEAEAQSFTKAKPR